MAKDGLYLVIEWFVLANNAEFNGWSGPKIVNRGDGIKPSDSEPTREAIPSVRLDYPQIGGCPVENEHDFGMMGGVPPLIGNSTCTRIEHTDCSPVEEGHQLMNRGLWEPIEGILQVVGWPTIALADVWYPVIW